jgi:hypothetical protein
MKLPIEPTEIRQEATLSKDQVNALITWYFDQFLNKTVQGVSFSIYSGEVSRATISCKDKARPAPSPEVPTNKIVKGTPLVDIE